MATKLIIEGNAVYEIDEECLECQKRRARNKNQKGYQEGGKENQQNKPMRHSP